jgi:GTPase Era involved in 16S rRNA processing
VWDPSSRPNSSLASVLSPCLRELEKACRRTPVLVSVATRLAALIEDLSRPPMVAVVGSFNAGKSTLINALLGREILKASALPANARVILLQYSDKPTLVGFTATGEKRTYDPTLLHQIAFEGDESFVSVRRDLSYLVYGYPHDRLRQVVLIDTPGLNATFEDHALSTADILSRVDVFVLVTPFMGAGKAGEIEFLRRLGRVVDLLVINRIDVAHDDEGPIEDQLNQMARKYGDLINEHVGVSASTAIRAHKSSDVALLSRSRWEGFADTFERVFRTRAQERKRTNALRQLKSTLSEAASAIKRLANETDAETRAARAAISTARTARLAVLSHLGAWKARSSQSWANMPLNMAGILKPLQATIQELVLEFSGLSAEMHINQAAATECRSEQVRLDQCVGASINAIAAYNATGVVFRIWDGLFGEMLEGLKKEEVDANSAARRNRDRAAVLEQAKTSLSLRERNLNVKERAVVKEVLNSLAGDYRQANLVLQRSRAWLRKIRWALSILPDLFDAIRSAREPIEQIELSIVNELEQEWMFPDATMEMAALVGEVGELRTSCALLLSHDHRYGPRTLLRFRKKIVRLSRELKTDKMAVVLSGIDEALRYFPASELSDVIDQLTSITQAESFAKALCGLAAGRPVSYEYLAKCVCNADTVDGIVAFARKNAPDGLDDFLHHVSVINTNLSREVYLRSGPHSRSRLVSITTIASELLTYLPEDITATTGVMA